MLAVLSLLVLFFLLVSEYLFSRCLWWQVRWCSVGRSSGGA